MKAHIFDLDGTLIDSMGVWVDIDRTFLSKRGIPMPPANEYEKFVANTIPLTPLESAAHVIKHFGLKEKPEEVMAEYNKHALKAYSSTVKLKVGAKRFLQSLREKGTKLSIATSAPTSLCIAALKNHGITNIFDAICMSEEVGFGKFRPDIFLLAAKRLDVRPEDCIVYDDNLTAIKTAKSIGMTTCGVYDESSEKEWAEIEQAADFVIRGFDELL